MNLTQMTTEVALALANMRSTQPWYPFIGGSASLPGYISRAANKLVRMTVGGNDKNFDLFPELDNSWTVGPTVSGSNVIASPSDCIAVRSVNRAESATLPNWNVTQEKPLADPIDPVEFGLLSKDSPGYAKIWSRKGTSILIHPTPTASYLDYLRLYGAADEPALINGTDTLRMKSHWHDLVVTLTCYLIAKRMGRKDDAAEYLTQVEQELQQTGSVRAWREDTGAVQVENAPSHLSVYGD